LCSVLLLLLLLYCCCYRYSAFSPYLALSHSIMAHQRKALLYICESNGDKCNYQCMLEVDMLEHIKVCSSSSSSSSSSSNSNSSNIRNNSSSTTVLAVAVAAVLLLLLLLLLMSESIIRRRNSLFGHITRLAEDTPAHQALRCHVDVTLGRFPDRSWRRRPRRPRNRWLDQLCRDNNSSPADLWRRASSRGHSGVTLRSSPTTR